MAKAWGAHVFALGLVFTLFAASVARASHGGSPQDSPAAALRPDSSTVARRLSDRSPVVRREAAEELARLAAVEHRRLVEGYRAQEKDSRARAALDWALYRMGRNESLFSLVAGLDSKKHSDQIVAYLKGLETPDPLYIFLERVNGRTRIRLLEVLAAVGDEDTLEMIEPYSRSLDPGIADAAKFAEREIGLRLANGPAVDAGRERRVGDNDEDEP